MDTESSALPPSYSETGSDPATGSLPGYSNIHQSGTARLQSAEGREEQEFDYKIERNGKSLVTMTLIASKATSKSVATFIEGRPVKGKITLALSREELDVIASLNITISGQLVTGGTNFWGATFPFLDIAQELPRDTWAQPGAQGDTVIPFSIDLPKTVPMAYGLEKKLEHFRLPQTFHERYIHATTMYTISVKVVRTGFFRSNEELSAPFGFVSVTVPEPIPPLRRLAYEEGTPLLGPKVDPDGWFLQKSVEIEGKNFNNQTVRVQFRLFLAKPLSYTRGSIIPLFLTIESDDKSSLDLLSSPKALTVRVRRRSRYHADPHKMIENKHWRDEVDHSQKAVWWPATEYSGEEAEHTTSRLRMLNGELHLKPTLPPTTAFGDFRIDYSVVFLKVKTPGFEQLDAIADNTALFEQPITIVTAFAPGPRPRMTTPANYEPDEYWDSKDIRLPEDGYSQGFF